MKDNAKLVVYTRDELRGGFVYNGYRPNQETIAGIRERMPNANLVVVSAGWCKDCRREVPKLAKILDSLPGWQVELRGDDVDTRQRLMVRAIPTIIVQDAHTGEELGRIIESPSSGSLEGDLLAISRRAPTTAYA